MRRCHINPLAERFHLVSSSCERTPSARSNSMAATRPRTRTVGRPDAICCSTQAQDGCTPCSCQAYQCLLVFSPAEMIMPVLRTRMEQRLFLAGHGVEGGGTIRFRKIAGGACQCAIGFVVRASQRNGNDVLQMEPVATGVLRRSTIFTTPVCTRFDPGTQAPKPHGQFRWKQG